ncbi:hypothetical protein ES703_42721 [subsurface metagenome]
MFRNIVWLSIINIKRKRLNSILYFVMAFFISLTLFLVNISNSFLRFPDFKAIQTFFYIIIFSVLFICIILLAAVSILFIRMRAQELGILRMHGAQKSDILFLSSIEILFISSAGAFAGILCVTLLIISKILYLPYFLEGIKRIELIKLIGLGGQTISGVIIIELVITIIIVSFLLKNDIPDLLGGSF